MKKRVLSLLLYIILIPVVVKAKEYNFNVCDNCDWNYNNLEVLNQYIESDLSRQDGEDNIYDNKYIIHFSSNEYNEIFVNWFYYI